MGCLVRFATGILVGFTWGLRVALTCGRFVFFALGAYTKQLVERMYCFKEYSKFPDIRRVKQKWVKYLGWLCVRTFGSFGFRSLHPCTDCSMSILVYNDYRMKMEHNFNTFTLVGGERGCLVGRGVGGYTGFFVRRLNNFLSTSSPIIIVKESSQMIAIVQ